MAESAALFSAETASVWAEGVLQGWAALAVFSVEVDSRKCRPGSLFFALSGERADGHDFVEQALKNGACGAAVSSVWANTHGDTVDKIVSAGNCFFLVVDDPLTALQKVAAGYMRGISRPVRVGITGSSGKTTTKELIASVLAEKYSVVKTAGNYNSEIGLPLTVFNIKNSHDYAVIEMGINRMGEMDVLAEILRPDIVVITNIGTAHIGIFKDIETIASEKRRALSRFDGDGSLFVFEDEPFSGFLSEGLKGTSIAYGEKSIRKNGGELEYRSLGLKGWEISIGGQLVKFPLIGSYNLRNAFCAIAVGHYAGVSNELIKKAFDKIEPLSGRSQIIEGAVTIINDCYNANADSLRQSVDFADGIEWSGDKLYVLGDMKELGGNSVAIHEQSGAAAAFSTAAEVIFFGEDSRVSFDAASAEQTGTGRKSPVLFHTSDFEELQEKILKDLKEGDLLLLKGSRSMSLERLLDPVVKKFGGNGC